MNCIKILWVDDEIELLKPHFLFLKERGYETKPCSNGLDALDLIKNQDFDNNSRVGLYLAVKRMKLRIFEIFFSIVGIC